ncbi:MAG: Ferrous-iron efflux pump FieF [Chlamydiae bacterium]|nr:Ferrous-iron efflux pump FieF [Chlamydiota bacterium]
MDKFPEAIPLPPSYLIARARRKIQLVKSIWKGIIFRLLIIIAEIVGFFFFSSYSLLFDGIASAVDVLFSLVLITGIWLAAKPPDEDHPFGHGRYEPLAGLQLAVFMIVGGAALAVQQFFSVIEPPSDKILNPWAWTIPMGAVLLLEISYRFMIHQAKVNNSPALKADAVHFRIDALNSLFAAVALLLVAFFPSFSTTFDHFGAMLIAALMVVIGINAARNNIHQLMDRKPDKKYFDLIRESAMSVDGVLDTEKLRIQLSGPDAHVDIDIEVDPVMNVVEAHRISQQVRASIQKVWPAVRDVVVHIEPYYPNDH